MTPALLLEAVPASLVPLLLSSRRPRPTESARTALQEELHQLIAPSAMHLQPGFAQSVAREQYGERPHRGGGADDDDARLAPLLELSGWSGSPVSCVAGSSRKGFVFGSAGPATVMAP